MLAFFPDSVDADIFLAIAFAALFYFVCRFVYSFIRFLVLFLKRLLAKVRKRCPKCNEPQKKVTRSATAGSGFFGEETSVLICPNCGYNEMEAE